MAVEVMRSGNPALSESTFTRFRGSVDSSGVMTIQGAVNKTGFLLLLVLLSAGYVWTQYFRDPEGSAASITTWMFVGAFGGFILAMVTVFKMEWAPYTAPIYALLEGLFIGAISSVAEQQFQGIVVQAVIYTFGTCIALLVAYKSGLIRATENFKLGVVAATGAIAIYYFLAIILGFFGIKAPMINDNGVAGIVFSLVVVTVAALNLVLDFDFIEKGAAQGAPKYMEWYGAFGLMVTLVWLYLEILRLLMKLRSRN
jgi:uncharacterized YccA/Bax inhibitor family protein